MKSLQEFKYLTEEEKSDYSKFDILVRSGLANKAQMQRIHKILDKMKEDKPQFNNADRMILQNLFNKMVDVLSNNKQILQQARKVVKEDTELEEGILDTADFKLTKDGRKVRAHRVKVGDAKLTGDADIKEEYIAIQPDELDESTGELPQDPPFVLVLKRKAVRLYPDKTKIALYYNKQINKYFSIPYGNNVDSPVQAEEYTESLDVIEESVMDQLHKIVKNRQSQTVKFGNGQTKKVDHFTASAITQVHSALNNDNKKKLSDMVHKSPVHLMKAADFAFSKAK
jgi:hypothetical protein